MPLAYLGLGSNMGDREANLKCALELLAGRVWVEAVSSLYETEPVGYREQALFLNAVCRINTGLGPETLLAVAKQIEEWLGRQPSLLNAPRPIDIDILFYDDIAMAGPELTIPHPRLAERGFVLVPLAEEAPDFVHPSLGLEVRELARRVQGEGVALYKKDWWQPQGAKVTE